MKIRNRDDMLLMNLLSSMGKRGAVVGGEGGVRVVVPPRVNENNHNKVNTCTHSTVT